MNYFFLCRFFLSFFLRLCVAILCRFRFFPQGTDPPPVFLSIKIRFAGPLQYSVSLAGMTTAIYFFLQLCAGARRSSRGPIGEEFLDSGTCGIDLLRTLPHNSLQGLEKGDLSLRVAPGVPLDHLFYFQGIRSIVPRIRPKIVFRCPK